jgi:DnaJ-class molecular chaperone
VTHYDVLGVDANATSEAIRAAYHALAAQYHPDRHQGNPLEELAREKLVRINEAFRVLSDAQRRAAYDSHLAAGAGRSGSTSPRASTGGNRGSHVLLLIALVLALPFLWRLILPLLQLLGRAARALLAIL